MNEKTTALVPDIPEVLALLGYIDDPLVGYLQPATDDDPEAEDWQMPQTLNVRATAKAWDNILCALPEPLIRALGGRRDDEPLPGSYELLTGAGYQRASLYPVTIGRADLAVMTNLLDHARRALPMTRPADHADLIEVLGEIADRRTDLAGPPGARGRACTADDVVAELETVLGLLSVDEQDGDALLLLAALGEPEPGSTVELRGEAAAAYDRWTGRLIDKIARDRVDAELIRFAV
ncbi:hypothetical protein ACIRD3_39490 [Kitasatospora sp. NPDC093550]|uniref:hypothetical protein n=1 Tax=Kitasatospora sp. NPDC093550 TaxID=3364089 RepID=UPI0037F41878